MTTYKCKELDMNEVLWRYRYEITILEDGVERCVVVGETECGSFLPEGEYMESDIKEINRLRVWV